jgi:hypothetical protein
MDILPLATKRNHDPYCKCTGPPRPVCARCGFRVVRVACSSCLRVWYCSELCRDIHSSVHKRECTFLLSNTSVKLPDALTLHGVTGTHKRRVYEAKKATEILLDALVAFSKIAKDAEDKRVIAGKAEYGQGLTEELAKLLRLAKDGNWNQARRMADVFPIVPEEKDPIASGIVDDIRGKDAGTEMVRVPSDFVWTTFFLMLGVILVRNSETPLSDEWLVLAHELNQSPKRRPYSPEQTAKAMLALACKDSTVETKVCPLVTVGNVRTYAHFVALLICDAITPIEADILGMALYKGIHTLSRT